MPYMTAYDAESPLEYLQDDEPETPIQEGGSEAPQDEGQEPDSPQAQPEPQAPPAPDMAAQLSALIQSQTERTQRDEQQRQEFQRAEQLRQFEANRPKALMEQDDWRARYDQAAEEMAYNPAARQTFMQLSADLADERAGAQVARMQESMRYEMRAKDVTGAALRLAQTQYGAQITEAAFEQAADLVFGQNRGQLAQILDPQINPNAAQAREMLSGLAVGLGQLRGQATVPPKNPVPPANPRSAERARPGTRQPTASMDEDAYAAFMQGAIDDAYTQSSTFAPRKK